MPTDPVQQELETRARRALVSYALFRWESAVLIGITILLAFFYPQPFPWWRWYYWLILGAVTETLIIFTSITDAETSERVVADMFREEHNPREIRSDKYRKLVERAFDYQTRIDNAVDEVESGALRDRLERADRGVADWVSQIFKLARRLDQFSQNEVIAEDMRAVPLAITNLDARYKLENNPRVQVELLGALKQKQAQWDNLQQLKDTMEGAEARLEATLTALGTIYSQVLLARAKSSEGAAAERLGEDIQEQVASLQDVIAAMDDVLNY
jgi:hypothetical protein